MISKALQRASRVLAPSNSKSRRSTAPSEVVGNSSTGQHLTLRITILRASNLTAKDSNGFSDPYVVVKYDLERQQTQIVHRTLNPEWNESFDFTVSAPAYNEVEEELLYTEITCWDWDRLGKDFMGQVRLPLAKFFRMDTGEVRMYCEGEFEIYRLEKRSARNVVSGEVVINCGFVGAITEEADRVWDELAKKSLLALDFGIPETVKRPVSIVSRIDFSPYTPTVTTAATMDEDNAATAGGSGSSSLNIDDADLDASLALAPTPPSLSDSSGSRKLHKKTTTLRRARLLGVVFLRIVQATDLPNVPNLAGNTFDMDPFVVVSFSRNTFRTTMKKHTLNPVWNEEVYFEVREAHSNFPIKFSVYDSDKFSNNDFVGDALLPVRDLFTEERELVLPLRLQNPAWQHSFSSSLRITARLVSYPELRRTFWLAIAQQYDVDGSGILSKIEVQAILDSLGGNLSDTTLDSFFAEHGKEQLRYDELVGCIEHFMFNDDETDQEDEEERVVQLESCPVCGRPLPVHDDVASVSHVAICTILDPGRTDHILLISNYETEAQAQRKWISKVVSRVGFGKYELGRNNANIIVIDRETGQPIEENMPMYVRLGIRLIYKNVTSRSTVDSKYIRNLFRNMSIKQGQKYQSKTHAKRQIKQFIKSYQINLDELANPDLDSYQCFNEFFHRRLKFGARVLDCEDDAGVAVSPADCRLICFEGVDAAMMLWIKGEQFSLRRLLNFSPLVEKFVGGKMAICRLAPQDYHRFHCPVDGTVSAEYSIDYVDGQYFTVNPMAVRSALDVYGENKRVVWVVDSEEFGLVAYICVGAMMVGSVVLNNDIIYPGSKLSRMDECGYFSFGGSTVILLFQRGRIKFDADLREYARSPLECLVKVGMRIGVSTTIAST